ncbi:hypothetical protein [uncultured Paraglaciecola sp.]|uniref:hypothetical protein n=1 Tax=uncultured Paraglaciecola sp. TaxID=1765024 RepID=UPI002614AE17|nr:hypothetical protein [uncultured Paraglaciecola sp.]
MCDYQGYEFGAHYPDSVCIDGYLWDADSGGSDENGETYLDSGGVLPCPECNSKSYVRYMAEDWNESGFCSYEHPFTTKMIKNHVPTNQKHLRRQARRHWFKGRREAIKEAKMEG